MRVFFVFGMMALFLQGCGSSCNVLSRLANEPSCRDLKLDAKRTIKPFNAACGTVNNSRRVSINCPASAGTGAQCTSLSSGFPLYSILLRNNNGGSFKDADGTIYRNCNEVLTALGTSPPSIQNLSGYYVSDNTTLADTLTCTDSGGCTLTSGNCYAAWDPVNRTTAGTASLSGNYLACTYIDNSAIVAPPAPAAVGLWAQPLVPVTASSPISFGLGAAWGDAY